MAPPLRSLTDPLTDPHPDASLRSVSDPRHVHHRPRFPSLTEFPDSPSVYSHAHHSPDVDAHFDTPPFSRLSNSPRCTEFDDETASTIHSFSTEDAQDDTDVDDCADDASHFISLQGPKIRFHSRAPWETNDDSSYVEEPDNSARSGTFGNKLKGKPSKTDSLIRTFTRGSSIGGRPSIDSARTQISVTSSFEVTAGNYSGSRGALYDLARQSMSTASLSSSSTSVRSQNFARTTNYPKPSRFDTHDSLARAVSLDGMVPSATNLERGPVHHSSFDAIRAGRERGAKPSFVCLPQERHSHDQFVHPYANPDLVAYTPSPETIPFHHPDLGDTVGCDANSTVPDSNSIRSAAFSDASTDTSNTSLTSRDIPHANLRVNGKEISSPISVLRPGDTSYVDRSTRFLSLHPPPAGFEGSLRSNLNSRPPAVTLITLQEAQARERFRGNTVHSTAARSKQPFPTSEDIPEVTEETEESAVEMDTDGKSGHTRARSTSAGARDNTILLLQVQPQNTEMRDESPVSAVSAGHGRTLKHKKSGFLRLFGGRNPETEKEKRPPPPIPPLADVYANGKPSKLSKASKSSLSPTLRSGASNATLASTYSATSDGDGPDGKGPPSRRRQLPPLSIVTKPSDHSIATSVSASSPMGLKSASPPSFLTVPQSAPPGNSNFHGLTLRPVSTSFSSHFADMVANTTEEVQHVVYSPSSAASSNAALSPFTPVSTRRSDDASATAGEASGEEYLTVKGLQDQLASAKMAWQQQTLELRERIRDLTSELEGLRAADSREYCEVCGRGESREHHRSSEELQLVKKVGVVNRPRARTGDTARFASGN